MCFIKTVYNPVEYRQSLLPINCCDQTEEIRPSEGETVISSRSKSQNNLGDNSPDYSLQGLLIDLLATGLKRNSLSINYVHEKLQECEEQIDTLLMELRELDSESQQGEKLSRDFNSELFSSEEPISIRQEFSENLLTNKLFGEKKYKYRLCLEEEFSKVIYKERNIKVGVSLKSNNGKAIKNSNIVNLCLGLADDNGNWINTNRVGDPMLKGKTEIQMYHGEAEFNKIYTKDISRTLPNGRVNIVIYAKPSMLIYDGLTSEYEEHVDQYCVEPLVIEDVVIKAKKKY